MAHASLRMIFSLAGLVAAGPAFAQFNINDSLTSLPAGPGFQAVDLATGNLPQGAALPYNGAPFTIGTGASAETIGFYGIDGNQGIVNGSLADEYAAPSTDASGDKYTGNYFSTGNAGYIDISFASPQKALALLWGSVDLSNDITFLMNGVKIGSVLGSDIDAKADGNQGFGGSFYTLINLLDNQSFNEIELSSGVTSFEAAEFEASAGHDYIPEPASLAVVGVALAGLVALRRRTA